MYNRKGAGWLCGQFRVDTGGIIMKKTWTAREFETMLRKNGFEYARCNGDHKIFKRNGRVITINVRGNGLNRMVARRLIKEYALEV